MRCSASAASPEPVRAPSSPDAACRRPRTDRNAQAVATEKLMGTPTISRFHAMFSIGGIAGASAGAFLAGRGVPSSAHLAWAAVLFLTFALAATPLLADTHARSTAAAQRPGRRGLRRLPLALLAPRAI